MALIKHAQTASLASDAVVLDLGDLRREADRMRARAQREAARIVEEARVERERLIAGAREEGFEAGREAGHAEGFEAGRTAGEAEARAEASERLDSIASSLTAALDRIDAEHERTTREARHDVLELAIAMGERVARRAIEVDPTAAARQVEAALEIVLRATDLIVRVHPDDLTLVETAMPSLARRLGQSARVRVEAEASLTRGSAVVCSEHGEIDATVEGQIARLVECIRPTSAEDAPPAAQPGDAGSDPA
jgi:flagellar biosynthesis/type III secretory pathway protein FliH